ncbi:aromatic compound dioxygenase [Heliocybe sulcata]|uniref:Aromatic compound dioxygenase n=1 Tax=Heliocybe sulcata TaxID=5364 RepID=A0A5C3ND76_9AGAM|nr:aromatic compound dioxygenase [Heliocybe sulcata]
MKFLSLVQLIALAGIVAAHPDPEGRMSRRELVARRSAAQARSVEASKCASAVAEFQARRKAKRSLHMKRDVIASTTLSTETPHYTTIQNNTCVTAPEVTEGPYYINNELVRTNLTEDQSGVPFIMDIGVLDVTTCTPLSNAFVELWHANATGVYGGYPATLGGPPASDSDAASDSSSGSASSSASAAPTGGAGGPGGGRGGSPAYLRNETFLRGGYTTNENGVVEIASIWPGFYEGRTPHVHTFVHLNWEMSDNGTLVSDAGNLAHIGQFFMDDSWSDQVFAVAPYTENTNNRTYNTEDGILSEENADGNNAFFDLEMLGDDISEGILGYITMGVNSSALYTIMNTNYYNSSDATTTAVAKRALHGDILEEL